MLDGVDHVLVLQDLYAAGYHSATQERMDESGLDFNHRLGDIHILRY